MERKEVKAYGTTSVEASLAPMYIPPRNLLHQDVDIGILFCDIYCTDLHVIRNDWGGAVYPVVPGHEINCRVIEEGQPVITFQLGDLAGVGCLVDLCRQCTYCQAGLELFCAPDNTVVFGWPESHLGGYTFDGLSGRIVVDMNCIS